MRSKLIPPLLGYYTMAGGGVATPWYLSGGISAANCIAAYQPKGAADYAASKVNLANPGTYDAVDGAAYPDWDPATGWKGNGANDGTCKRLVTTIQPSSTSWSVIARYSGAQGSNDAVAVAEDYLGAFRTWGIKFYFTGETQRWYCGSSNYYGQALAASGVMALAGTNAYLDGALVGTIEGGTMPTSGGLYLLASPYSNGLNGFVGYVQALAIYDTDITAYVAALTTAMAAL